MDDHSRPLASRQEVAAYLGIPSATLTQWAHRNTGPVYRLIGRHARYRWVDVHRWVEQQRGGGEAA